MDVAPKQIVGVSAALIPFLEHDDANRALMGSNMQRQAVPLIQPEAPIVATGMEGRPRDSGQVVLARRWGEVVSVTGDRIVIWTRRPGASIRCASTSAPTRAPALTSALSSSRASGCKKGEVLADSSSTDGGELALGQNVLCAFLSWEGGNYEDAILISESLVREDKFTSIHIEKHEVEARDTKLGPEEITRDIPNVGEEALKDLDEEGIIRIGAEVGLGHPGGQDHAQGREGAHPRGEAAAGHLRREGARGEGHQPALPHGERGKVVDVKVFTATSTATCRPAWSAWCG
jgi:DNA-directed RNA polymerase subunit beta